MMDLLPWRRRGSKDLVGFKSEFDNLFNRFFDVDFPFELFKEGQWVPRVDVNESKKKITVKAEIPGCDVDDINVGLDGRILTIKGEKKQEEAEKEKSAHRLERAYGYFTRTLTLPTEVDQEEVDATYKKGVLKIVLKKAKEAEGKKIDIKTG